MKGSIKAYWELSRSVAVRERCKDAFAVTLVLLLGVSASPSVAALPPDFLSELNQPAISPLVAALPPDFQETVVFSGLNEPTALQFSPDGRVFVAEKRGVIKVFDGLTDSTPTVFADLRTNVYNFWDRGLLGLALDPEFPTRPYVYALYAYDAAIGGIAPRWGTPNTDSDPCPNPPGATGDGCVVSARLSRLEAAGNVMTGAEQVLITDWCQQYPSHSIGALAFGADGALYVSGGDGASFTFTDYGQDGNPLNPCGDPPGGVGASLSTPTAEGGALRSQDLVTPGDPVTLDGTILRIDPDTGDALPDNPLASDSDPNARRIVAYGLRNPFRFTIRPGTNELWIGDVGWTEWEEINRIVNPLSGVTNFGWPCYEGTGTQGGYAGANLTLCEDLYGQSTAVTPPIYAYHHAATVVSGETCPAGSSAISGLAFYNGGSYPANYNGALFFADYARTCIWVMFNPPGSTSTGPTTLATFAAGAANPVDLKTGPAGDLFYADFDGGAIRRVQYTGAANQPPTAVAQANPSNGPVPLTVAFDGTGSSDPDPSDTISHAWDLDGDGQYDDAATAAPSFTYTAAGAYTVRLRVTDNHGASSISSPLVITVGSPGNPPTATITAPASTATWKVNDVISFSGQGTDPEDGVLPASAFTWQIIIHHCPSNCHTHSLQSFSGITSGSFDAPDHDYPTHLEIKLTVTDSSGAQDSDSVLINPQTVQLQFETNPSGLQLTVGPSSGATPFNRTVIVGSNNSLSAPSPQTLGGTTYAFTSWSDGGTQTHNVVAGSIPATYTATYAASGTSGLVAAYGFNEGSGTTVADASSNGHTGTLTGATWSATGQFGGALSFDGTNDWVTVADAVGLDLTTGMTLEAWVNPTALSGWRTVMMKESTGGLAYSLYAHDNAPRPATTVNTGGADLSAIGGAALPLNTWAHLAATYNGATLRLYLNGAEVGSLAVSGSLVASASPLRFGGNAVWGEYFAGRIDEVRVYNRALTQSEIQTDMNTPIGGGGAPDTTPPTAPSNLGATPVSATQINLSWTASSDNVGVSGYQVERCQGAGCTSFVQVATPTGTSFSDSGLTAGTTYQYRVRATDAAGNLSGYSNVANATTQPSGGPPGLVAAYSFNEGAGSSVADASGNAHPGTISGATWTAAGRFGNALSFDGTNDWVTVADATDLDLTTGMTLEAWVNPSVLSGWRTAILKEQLNGLAYGLYAHDNAPPRPAAYVNTGGADKTASGGSALSLNTWAHLAATYNGTTLLLYVNGTQVASKSVTGAMVASGQPLRIGGNAVWGEYLKGRIDEVRVYNRALTQSEIQSDMAAPVQ